MMIIFLVGMLIFMSVSVSGLVLKNSTDVSSQNVKKTYRVEGYITYKGNNNPVEGVKVGSFSTHPGKVGSFCDYTDNNGYYCLTWDSYPGPACLTCDESTIPEGYKFSPYYSQIYWIFYEDTEITLNFKVYKSNSKNCDNTLNKNIEKNTNDGTIYGYAYKGLSDNGLDNAEVTLSIVQGDPFRIVPIAETNTDEEGYYEFCDLSVGENFFDQEVYFLKCSKSGYKTLDFKDTSLYGSQNTARVDFNMFKDTTKENIKFLTLINLVKSILYSIKY